MLYVLLLCRSDEPSEVEGVFKSLKSALEYSKDIDGNWRVVHDYGRNSIVYRAERKTEYSWYEIWKSEFYEK